MEEFPDQSLVKHFGFSTGSDNQELQGSGIDTFSGLQTTEKGGHGRLVPDGRDFG